MRSNCILFAFALWWRRHGKGERGYVAWRLSDWGNFPHALYVSRTRKRFISYKPVSPIKRRFPPFLFIGRVAWGD